MKIYDSFEQNSLQWLCARAGKITASEADTLVTPKWEIRKGVGLKTYLAQKVAELWTQGPLPTAMTLDMEAGKIREEEAIPWLEFELGWNISRPAMIATDDGRCACSPDGWMPERQIGIEIKCPMPVNHVKYVLDNKLPDDYAAQVQFSLWVTGAKEWRFVSYRRGFPALIVNVTPDAAAQESISQAVADFIPRLDKAMEEMTLRNGGTRPQANTFRESLLRETTPEHEMYANH